MSTRSAKHDVPVKMPEPDRQPEHRPSSADEMRQALRASLTRVKHLAAREREGERGTGELRQLVLR